MTQNQVGVPKLVWSDVRRNLAICGIDDETRGAFHAMQYAQCLMSEVEFTEFYKEGSETYRASADATVQMINQKAGK